MKKFNNRIYLSSPTVHGDDFKYVEEAYNNNWISTVGENLDEVEKSVAEKIGCKNAVALSCGTAALHLAVKLCGVKKGDTVFASDLTFSASVNPVLYEHATPVFIDSEYDTWNMSPEALKKAFELYPDTKVVIVVNLYGVPAKLDEICAIAEEHGAVVIEDAAESLGSTYKGKQTGSYGICNAISFNGNKIITGSSGGMLLTDSDEVKENARKWSTQSKEAAPWYQHEQLGYNYRMSNLIAGMVRGQFPYLEEHIARKKAIYERYKNGLADLPIKMNPFDEKSMSPNFWLSCMTIDKEAMCYQSRSETEASYVTEKGKSCPTEILQTLEEFNAEGRPIWKPMHAQPIFKNSKFVSLNAEAVSSDIFIRGLCLPSDIKMTQAEQDKIIEIIKSCFK